MLCCRDACEPDHVATCAWDASAITGDDPKFSGLGGMDTGHDFHAAPDLDHTNWMVQAGLSDFTRCVQCHPLLFTSHLLPVGHGWATDLTFGAVTLKVYGMVVKCSMYRSVIAHLCDRVCLHVENVPEIGVLPAAAQQLLFSIELF